VEHVDDNTPAVEGELPNIPQGGHRVLVVDDLESNTRLLEGFLRPMGFEVDIAFSGESALERVAEHPPDIMLLDLMMPGMDGFEVCQRMKQDATMRHIPVIIITGLTDRQANVKAIEAGADDFVIKPFDRVLLEARIRSSLKTKMLQDEVLAHQHILEEKVQERTEQLMVVQQVTVFSLAKLAESRDNETGDHLERMRMYARELASEMIQWPKYADTVPPEFPEKVFQSSPLHDIGKVGIPDDILLKPGPLDTEEFEIMKTHTLIGGETLRAADYQAGKNSFLAMGRDIAYYHHEKWDGSGYPYGMAGEAIPLAARIVALADVYDALSSRRPYKEPFSHEKSKAIILEGRGKHFDPEVVDAFLARESRFLEIREKYQGDGKLPPLHEVTETLRRHHAELAQANNHRANRLQRMSDWFRAPLHFIHHPTRGE